MRYYTQPKHATLRGVKYAISVFEAIAQNKELPLAVESIMPPSEPVNMMTLRQPLLLEDILTEVNQVCKGATAYHLLKKSTVPLSMRYVSSLFNMTEDELWTNVKKLENLQYLHNCIEYDRLDHEYRQRIIAEQRAKELAAKLAMSVEDRMAVIKGKLVCLAEDQDWRDPNGIDLETISDKSCRLIAFFEQYQNPKMPATRIAKLAGISSTLVGQAMKKLLRQWRHPARYGDIFRLRIEGGPRSRMNILEIVNPLNIDEDGDMLMDIYDNLTFGECIAKINAFLKQFDESIRLPLWAKSPSSHSVQ